MAIFLLQLHKAESRKQKAEAGADPTYLSIFIQLNSIQSRPSSEAKKYFSNQHQLAGTEMGEVSIRMNFRS